MKLEEEYSDNTGTVAVVACTYLSIFAIGLIVFTAHVLGSLDSNIHMPHRVFSQGSVHIGLVENTE